MGENNGQPPIYIKPMTAEEMDIIDRLKFDNAKLKAENEKMKDVFAWLNGYEDFPQRKDGQGLYYWRVWLDKKLKEIDIDIHAREALKAQNEIKDSI